MKSRRFALGARRVLLVFLFVAWCGILVGSALAQDKAAKKAGETAPAKTPAKAAAPADDEGEPEVRQWKTIKPDETLKKNSSRVMTGILPSGKFGPGDQEMLDEFFTKYLLAQWTLPENRSSLPSMRGKLRNSFRTAKGGAVYDHLNALVMGFMNKVARDKEFHPVLRVNAVLMIGELNAAEPPRPSDAPTPLPDAVEVLQGLLDEPGSEAVNVSAMVGLIRQARFGLSDALRPKFTARMVDLLAGDSASRSSPGHTWLRAQAAEALGLLGLPGSDGAVARELAGVVADSKSPLGVRCTAATALGQLDYQGAATAVNASNMVSALAQLTLDACAEEKPLASRRRLKPRLFTVSQGLMGVDERHGGVKSLATTEAQRAQVTALHGVIKVLADCADDVLLLEKIKESRSKLQSLLKKPAE